MATDSLAAGIIEYLAPKGFAGWPRCVRVAQQVTHAVILDRERTPYREVVRFDLVLGVFSQEVYGAGSPLHPEYWSSSSLVSASLFYLTTGTRGLGWPIRRDDSDDMERVLELMIDGLVNVGLPFLDRIQTSDDVIRVMTTTEFSGFDHDLTRRIVEGYRASKA